MKTVLFYRSFKKFQGGHLKVWDYFNHVVASPDHDARICFSESSAWDERNPWRNVRERVVFSDADLQPDVLFLAGRDWERIPEARRQKSPVPVINFIQHVRHGYPDNPRFPFLSHRAIRICNSEETAESIRATGRVEGPIYTIPYGLERSVFPKPLPPDQKDLDVVVVAIKRPELARRLRWLLWRPGRRVHVLSEPILRHDFLGLMNRARVSVFLPNPTEGFYIPALEAMAVESIVVCPDVEGNRSFCRDGETCFRPPFRLGAVRAATERALRLAPESSDALRAGARAMFERHDLAGERARFLEILNDVDHLW